MAVLSQSAFGQFSGRVGTAVGYMWKGKACVRVYRKEINYPNTPHQQRQRDWFVGMVRFASKATAALRLGLRQRASEAGMTEGNWFVKQNKRWFGGGDTQGEVDYQRLVLASGPAADVYFKTPRFEENETVVVEFEKNSLSLHASGADKVYLYVYAPGLGQGMLTAPAERRSKRLAVRLPEEWAGQEVHLYGFVVDREGRSSDSTYIGVGRVNHYEERGRYFPVNKGWKDFVDMASGVSSNEDVTADTASHQPSHDAAAAPARHDLFADMPPD
ncbi:MAG: hypothetical protein IJ760_03555 [Bacteroidales bacterium]|nr:hypothetical protein [Bacteroidales bacterium]